MQRRYFTITVVSIALLAACGQVAIPEIPTDIGAEFDLDSVLDEVRDCDRVSESFVAVVSEAADQIDELAGRSGGRVDPPELREKIDAISVTEYFAIAERIGCERLQLQADTLDQLRDLDPGGTDGQELVDTILDGVQEQS